MMRLLIASLLAYVGEAIFFVASPDPESRDCFHETVNARQDLKIMYEVNGEQDTGVRLDVFRRDNPGQIILTSTESSYTGQFMTEEGTYSICIASTIDGWQMVSLEIFVDVHLQGSEIATKSHDF